MAAGSFWEIAVMVLNPPAGHQMQVMTHFLGIWQLLMWPKMWRITNVANICRSAAKFEDVSLS